MLTRTIGAREANQHFSALLKAVEEDGATVIITRRGKAIARMQRAAPTDDADTIAARMDRLFELYARPTKMEGKFDRDALHDRHPEETP